MYWPYGRRIWAAAMVDHYLRFAMVAVCVFVSNHAAMEKIRQCKGRPKVLEHALISRKSPLHLNKSRSYEYKGLIRP